MISLRPKVWNSFYNLMAIKLVSPALTSLLNPRFVFLSMFLLPLFGLLIIFQLKMPQNRIQYVPPTLYHCLGHPSSSTYRPKLCGHPWFLSLSPHPSTHQPVYQLYIQNRSWMFWLLSTSTTTLSFQATSSLAWILTSVSMLVSLSPTVYSLSQQPVTL